MCHQSLLKSYNYLYLVSFLYSLNISRVLSKRSVLNITVFIQAYFEQFKACIGKFPVIPCYGCFFPFHPSLSLCICMLMHHNTLVQKRVVFLSKLENHLTNMYLLYRVHTGRYYTGSTKALTAPLCQRGAPNPKAMRSWENPAYLLSILHKAWDNKEILILSCITSMLLREEDRRVHSEGRPERACPTPTASFNGFYHTFSGVGHWLPLVVHEKPINLL